jgi:hypothetical protein
MSILSAIPLLGRVLGKAGDIIDKAVPDKDLATKLKADIESQALSMDHTEVTQLVEEQSSIIRAEINSPSWLAANWRPILMLTIVAIIANNYIVYPYLSMFTDKATVLELPADLYDLMKIGVGGYTVGRSLEKIGDKGGAKKVWGVITGKGS